jgi:hypothetical protein
MNSLSYPWSLYHGILSEHVSVPKAYIFIHCAIDSCNSCLRENKHGMVASTSICLSLFVILSLVMLCPDHDSFSDVDIFLMYIFLILIYFLMDIFSNADIFLIHIFF